MLLNCKGKLVLFNRPAVMGIINITPDSFYKGYLGSSMNAILNETEGMINAGADIIDIGGQSTRPCSTGISPEEEMSRVIPVIRQIHNKFPGALISIDTYYSVVASAAVEAGAMMVNDISAGLIDSEMLSTVAGLRVPYICMHMNGTPATMQLNTHYDDIITEMLDFFNQRIKECIEKGIIDIIIDPGFGFGKSVSDNFYLLKNLPLFKICGKPILAGISRKSTVYKTLNIQVEDALNGSTVLHTLALLNGASIIRVHDVKEAWEVVELIEKYKATS